MLGRVAHAAPPQDRAPLDDIVEPALADLLGSQVGRESIICQRAQKGKGAGDIVVGDDQDVVAQPLVAAFVLIVPDLAQLGHDLVIPPAFKRATQIDADDFAEHTGIDTFEVVGWKLNRHDVCLIFWTRD